MVALTHASYTKRETKQGNKVSSEYTFLIHTLHVFEIGSRDATYGGQVVNSGTPGWDTSTTRSLTRVTVNFGEFKPR